MSVGKKVQGFCPMGCGAYLVLGEGGFVTCSWLKCPNPGAATILLDTKETEHVVQFEDYDFTIQHPLKERLNGYLWECNLHKGLNLLSGPPVKPGRYRAIPSGDVWKWIPLP